MVHLDATTLYLVGENFVCLVKATLLLLKLGYLKNDNSADVSVLLSFNARVLNQPEVIRFINNCLRNHLCLCTFFVMILHLAVAHDLAG